MNWRPHTETPDERITALIARTGSDGELFLDMHIHKWNGDVWHRELDWENELDCSEFYGMPECELLNEIKR